MELQPQTLEKSCFAQGPEWLLLKTVRIFFCIF